MRAPSAWNFFGFSRNSLISCSSSTASSTPATSRKVILGESTDMRFARDLPKDMTFEPPPCIWLMMKSQKNRSEEHTSELQSLAYLVCRLLLEKKKYNDKIPTSLIFVIRLKLLTSIAIENNNCRQQYFKYILTIVI